MTNTTISRDAPRLYVGGEWRTPRSNDAIDVIDPATGERIGEIAAAGSSDIDDAVQAAGQAMRARWAPTDRQTALLALADAIDANAEEFAAIEMRDAGKPITAARRVDVPVASAALRYFAGWAPRIAGETAELSLPGDWHACTLREPVGIVGQIIPWNYPLMGAAMKIGPAIAAGCATVLKPAELTSLSALRLAELLEGCGFPPGRVNIVPGHGPVAGAALVAHHDVAKIAFTGSTAIGRTIVREGAATMKRVTVELGGKSPVIVLPDADLDAAARATAMNIFLNAGQTCSAGSRLLVHASVADALVSRIVELARGMRIGSPTDPATMLGPLISARQRERVLGYVERALADGATAVTGGGAVDGPGFFVAPTVLAGVEAGMAAVEEEIFGPVLCVLPFDTLDLDAIAALANATPYGLAAYVWTTNLGAAHGLVRRLRAGTVKVNAPGGSDFAMPAGGVKQSGFGRENGRVGVEAYTEIKSVTLAY